MIQPRTRHADPSYSVATAFVSYSRHLSVCLLSPYGPGH